jgi:nicotinamide mononucleotide (NMN) deamidase PncC
LNFGNFKLEREKRPLFSYVGIDKFPVMGLLDRFDSGSDQENNLRNLVDRLSNDDETVAIFEPVTSGLLTHSFSSAESVSKVVAGGVAPASKRSYERFIELGEMATFPHKEVANNEDAQILANRVKEEFGADHGISVLANLDGTAQQKVYIGLNILDRNTGVFEQEIDFQQEDLDEKIVNAVLEVFAREYARMNR